MCVLAVVIIFGICGGFFVGLFLLFVLYYQRYSLVGKLQCLAHEVATYYFFGYRGEYTTTLFFLGVVPHRLWHRCGLCCG